MDSECKYFIFSFPTIDHKNLILHLFPVIVDDEVEKIIKHETVNNTRYFLVQLKNSKRCVRIPLTHKHILSENLILDYYMKHNIKADDLPLISRHKRADELYNLLTQVSDAELNLFVRRFDNLNDLSQPNIIALKDDLLRSVPVTGEIQLSNSDMASLRYKALIEVSHQRRKKQLKSLEEKEWSLNVMSDHDEPIFIENNVDFVPFPDFKYVNHFVPGQGVKILKTPPDDLGCGAGTPENVKHVCDKKCICMEIFEVKPAYDRHGLMVLNRGERIHECNKKCRCDDSCRFRVVQKRCKIPFLIFRCSNGTGWGVKALRSLPKGSYIGRYFGKVILWEEAESLPAAGGRKDYLFDIDYLIGENGHCKYTVDAYEYGNFTRFINHSCAPNLVVHHAWINMLDDNLHDLAFFTSRPIVSGEELTFNYNKVFTNCKCSSYECIRRRIS